MDDTLILRLRMQARPMSPTRASGFSWDRATHPVGLLWLDLNRVQSPHGEVVLRLHGHGPHLREPCR